MSSVEYNQGARQTYGPSDVERKAPSSVVTYGAVRQLIVPLVHDDLPEANDQDNLIPTIPANSFIISARVHSTVDWESTSGTTNLLVGLSEPDGDVVDADGLVEAFAADDFSAGSWEVGDGDIVGASVGADDVQVTAEPSTDDLTAGRGVVIIEYITPPGGDEGYSFM